jgi:hypothetical protein
MGISVLLIIAIGLFVGLVVIPHLHFIAVAIAHLFHPHVLGVVLGAVVLTLLLLSFLGFIWVAPARVMAPAPPVAMRAEPGRAVMEVHDAPTATRVPEAVAMREEVSSSPAWSKLGMLALALLGIAGLGALIANPHFRAFLQSRPGAITLAACPLAVIVVLFLVRSSYHSTKMSAEIDAAQATAFEAAHRNVAPKPTSIRNSDKPTNSKTTAAALPSETTAERSETDPASLPDWVHREPSPSDNPYYVVVNSGDFTEDSFAREEMLNAQTANAVDQYIRTVMRRPAEVVEAVKFDPSYLRSTYSDEQYPPAGAATTEKSYVRLKFDSRFRDEVDRRWRDFVSSDRLEKLSGFSAVGLALLGVVYIYLRATSPKPAT